MAEFAEIYSMVFTHGRIIEQDGRLASFTVMPVGRVSLPSGQVVASDPLTTGLDEPFVQTVLPGRYLVDLSLMRLHDGTELVAMARITFTNKRPAVWVMALREGENPEALTPGQVFGYRSESGTGSFMDCDAAAASDFAHADDVDELLLTLTENYKPQRYWMDYELDRRLNVVMFSSGRGEGTYPSYFGIDDAGDVCALVTDFQLVSV